MIGTAARRGEHDFQTSDPSHRKHDVLRKTKVTDDWFNPMAPAFRNPQSRRFAWYA